MKIKCEGCGNTEKFTLESCFDFNSENECFESETFSDKITCDDCGTDRCVIQDNADVVATAKTVAT